MARLPGTAASSPDGESALVTADGLRVIAAVRDISERVLAEARMREVQGVLDATRDAVLVFDPDTLVFAYVNQGPSTSSATPGTSCSP